MNTTTRFFQTKDQYLAFRNAFAAAQNNKRTHKSYSEGTAEIWDSQTKKYKTIATKIKHDGWMCSAHYLLFNLVCGKNYYSGFSPKMKEAFIGNGGNADRGLNETICYLSSLITAAQCLLNNNLIKVPSWRQKEKDKQQFLTEETTKFQNHVNVFLEPFGGVFTLQDLARIQLPSFPGMTSEQVKEYTGKSVTYRELFREQIVDQTSTFVVPEVQAVEPEKKGVFSRMFS